MIYNNRDLTKKGEKKKKGKNEKSPERKERGS